jgi:hypothetical protein
VLSVQIGGYGTGRNLYDDEGGDPGVRVADAAMSAALLARSLDRSERLANQFWSQLSHIGVHHDADGGS